jgi:hypothetical protein
MKNNNNNNNNIPVTSYYNVDENKCIILYKNRRKSGIYRWNNLINGKSYIGSSIDLNNRLRAYYSITNLKRITSKEQSMIYKSLLKYGHENFSLDIIEYCERDILIEKEQYYLDLLKPEYNILKFAGSRLNHIPSEKTRKLISVALMGKKYKCNEKEDVLKKTTKFTYGVSVKVFNKSNNLIFKFPSIGSAARYFNVSDRAISNIRDRGKSYDDYIYIFEDIKVWVYNNNKELINVVSTKKIVSELYGIPCTTLSRYIESGELYKNKFFFVSNKDLLKPEHSILNIAGSGNKLLEETKQKINGALKNNLIKLLSIKVTDIKTNTTKSFPNNMEAAKYLGVSVSTLGRYKSNGKILLKTYKITNNIYINKSYK